jgi:hypothetical protein
MSRPLGHDRSIRRGLLTVCLSGMLEDKLDAVAGAGFDGVETRERPHRIVVDTGGRNAEFNPPPARSLAPDPRWHPASQARCPGDDLEQE